MPVGSGAWTEQEVSLCRVEMYERRPVVAAKAMSTASNCPRGWQKNTAASIRALYFVGANLKTISDSG